MERDLVGSHGTSSACVRQSEIHRSRWARGVSSIVRESQGRKSPPGHGIPGGSAHSPFSRDPSFRPDQRASVSMRSSISAFSRFHVESGRNAEASSSPEGNLWSSQAPARPPVLLSFTGRCLLQVPARNISSRSRIVSCASHNSSTSAMALRVCAFGTFSSRGNA